MPCNCIGIYLLNPLIKFTRRRRTIHLIWRAFIVLVVVVGAAKENKSALCCIIVAQHLLTICTPRQFA